MNESDQRMLEYNSKLKAALDNSTGRGSSEESCGNIDEFVACKENSIVPNNSLQRASTSRKVTSSSSARSSCAGIQSSSVTPKSQFG